MAEEEAGFTFVDKRRTQIETPPVTAAQALPEAVLESAELENGAAEEALDDSQSPSTYDLIGYCLNLFASQAWQKLGLLADPQTGEAQPDLAEAKIAIDVAGDLAARLEAAPDTLIPAEARRELRTLLNDLRLNYVSRRDQDVSPLS